MMVPNLKALYGLMLGGALITQACAAPLPCRMSATLAEETAALAAVYPYKSKVYGQAHADSFRRNFEITARQVCGTIVRLRFDPGVIYENGEIAYVVTGPAEEFAVDMVTGEVVDYHLEGSILSDGTLDELTLKRQTPRP